MFKLLAKLRVFKRLRDLEKQVRSLALDIDYLDENKAEKSKPHKHIEKKEE